MVHSFHCSAHVLLGFSRNVGTNLTSLQKELETEVEKKLGRGAMPVFTRFGNEPAATRVVRLTASLGGVLEALVS